MGDFLNFLREIILKEKAIRRSVTYMLWERRYCLWGWFGRRRG